MRVSRRAAKLGFRPGLRYSNDQLAATWRAREAHLVRMLSTRNLDSIKETFDTLCVAGKSGLSANEFVEAMLKLFGDSMPAGFDRQEFAIQLLELFAAIDVRV